MAHRDCDHCESTESVTHRVTPWKDGKRQDHLHAYLCHDCAVKHRHILHHTHGYGCVETRPIIPLGELLEMAARNPVDISETVILEDIPPRGTV